MTSPMERLDDTGVAAYLKGVQAQQDDSQHALF
jgi:hypothetical protein